MKYILFKFSLIFNSLSPLLNLSFKEFHICISLVKFCVIITTMGEKAYSYSKRSCSEHAFIVSTQLKPSMMGHGKNSKQESGGRN